MHDFLRFWWDLLALNMRKTVFRLRGAKGHAPCHAASDSGKAHETHCDACMQWDKPARFARVCPLLTQTPDGWRCAANAADVRPFWGRALGYFGGAGAGLYLLATLGAFGLMREVGYDVRYADVVWPPAWRQFEATRSKLYFEKGKAALAQNDIGEASRSLALAFEFDPTNYEAGMLLAQLWQSGQMALADWVYRQLLVSHPAQADATARAWGRALLWRGDFGQLAQLANGRLKAEPATATVWVHALIFSARQRRDGQSLSAARDLPELSAEARALLRLESASIAGDVAGTVRSLLAPLSEDATAYARYYQLSFLINAGEPRRALELLTAYGAKLPPDERVGFSLGALAKMGENVEMRRQAAGLLATNRLPQIYEILAAHLIRHPDTELLRATVERLVTEKWADGPEGAAAHAALLCAAGVDREFALVDQLRTRMRRATRSSLKALDRAEAFFAERNRMTSPGNFLAALPMLPLETVYALFEAAARERRQP